MTDAPIEGQSDAALNPALTRTPLRVVCFCGAGDIAGMTQRPSSPLIALAAAIDLPEGGDAPEWVHLLPTCRGEVRTFDGRGPYLVADAAAIIAASFQDPRGLPIDENHAHDLAAPAGGSSPARGWIKEMQARADGVWGRVEWTKAGRELVADRAYRGISPVMFLHADEKTVRSVPRASLVNKPNLQGLALLHMETPMKAIAEMLGLGADATEEKILAAIKAMKDKKGDAPALQSALTEIGTSLGLDGSAAPDAILAAAKVAGQDGKTTIPALQAQVTELSTRLKAVADGQTRSAAEAYVDGQIKAGRMGLNQTNRAEFVAMHMENPTRTEKLVGGFAVMPTTTTTGAPPNSPALHAETGDLVSRAKALQASEKAKGIELGWTDAVLKASEAKQ